VNCAPRSELSSTISIVGLDVACENSDRPVAIQILVEGGLRLISAAVLDPDKRRYDIQ